MRFSIRCWIYSGGCAGNQLQPVQDQEQDQETERKIERSRRQDRHAESDIDSGRGLFCLVQLADALYLPGVCKYSGNLRLRRHSGYNRRMRHLWMDQDHEGTAEGSAV